jgi:nitroimidazol reductase NimA-like FMN-containing flavoprotein (pyridoxamine 5'-phosphate oxidase superfamily)
MLDTHDPVVAGLLDPAQPNLARLAYIGLDGRPRVVPIWFLYRNDAFVMVTGPKAEKVPAIEKNGAVALTIDSSAPPYHALLVNGDAIVEKTDGMAAEYPDLARRYLGPAADAYLASMQSRVKEQRRITVRPRSHHVLDFQQRFPKSLR